MSCYIQVDYTSPAWEALPKPVRLEVRTLCELVKEAPEKNLTAWMKQQALRLDISYSSFRRKYYALSNSNGDWQQIVDGRKVAVNRASEALTRQPRFAAEVAKLVEDHQRNNQAGFRALRRRWVKRAEAVPGYEEWPGWPKVPAGWTDRNLARIVREESTRARRTSIRIGTSSKTNPYLPTVHTTRVGLWPGAVIQLDDVWHDNLVTLGKRREVVRVLELGALDLFSANRFHWGAKPRRRAENGKWETLRGKDMRLFLAGMLHRTGYSPHGTMLMSEWQTAKVEEDIARTLYDTTGGLVRVDYQPIEGKQAALCGYWNGTEGGNFRAKACLESTHNLMHNDLAALPMQTGSPSSGLKGPVVTERMVAYIARILKSVAEKVPQRLELLRLPTLDFHTQFLPFLMDYYQFGLNARTDHELEGWDRLQHVIGEYCAVPGSDQFFGEEVFLSLPSASQMVIREAARQNPELWTRRRNLAPAEVWQKREKFTPVPAVVLCDILTDDLAREVTARRGFLEFCDQDIAPDPLIYQARYFSGPLKGREIPHGEKVKMFALPFDDATALVVDARGFYLGEVALYRRVLPIDPGAFGSAQPFEHRPEIRSQELREAAGEKHSRIADILEPTRILHREAVSAAQDLREHNRRVVSGAPVTPEELAAARSEAGCQAASTRRVAGWGQEIDSATAEAAAAALQSPCSEAAPHIAEEDIASWLND